MMMSRAANPTRRSRLAVLGAAMAVCLAFAGISAASASAFGWNTQGVATISGSVTFTASGQPNRTCGVNAASTLVIATNYPAPKLAGDLYFAAPCSPGGFYRFYNAFAGFSAGAWTITNQWNGQANPTTGPWGVTWKQQTGTVLPWTNAAGANPSKIVLNNTILALDSAGLPIRGTGTLNFTTSGGGALTLSP